MKKRTLRTWKQAPASAKDDRAREKKRAYDASRDGRNRGIYRSAQDVKPPTKTELAEAYAFDKRVSAERAALEAERERCRTDLKYLWEVAFKCRERDEITGELYWQEWGRIHELGADFSNTDIIKHIKTYSPIPELMPERDKHGMFKERWVYFRTLQEWPEVYDGPPGLDNPIATLFYGGKWQGVMLRFKGDGRTLLGLMPRGWLKTTIFGMTRMLQRMIREPAGRNILRSAVDEKASEFLGFIKNAFQQRPHFKKLFGYLMPENAREGAWNDSMLQFNVPREGIEPTLRAAGINVEQVGSHWKNGLCDDVVGEKNTQSVVQIQKTNTQFMNLQAQRDPNSTLYVNGTRWTEDDCNGELLKKDALACFMVVSALDGDQNAQIPDLRGITSEPISLLGYGKLLWGERWNYVTLALKRKFMPVDSFYFGQFFNQRHGVTSHVFKKQWIRPIPERYRHLTMPELARELKLRITMGGDAASGDPDQKGKLDRTALHVLGQTQDREHSFWLDGCCEKLPAELIAKAFVNLGCKWHEIAESYGGTFVAGVEKEAHNHFLNVVIKNEMKRRGIHSTFRVVPCLHGNRTKPQRIRTLAVPHSLGYFYWPDELWVRPTVEEDADEPELYDLRPIHESQFCGYTPKATDDDSMDAEVYAYELQNPQKYAEMLGPQNQPEHKKGAYSREKALARAEEEPENAMAGGGYEHGEFGMGIER